ncbi:YueH family protein [Bacillus thermotolerans]|uniref:YueH family protein n=1 Tax=Bacillus thermotolerans TaxID=1221996 RepID=A0A0F5I1K4_BACTR|nr:YueH family protein [Bacillus thermotolerans]KKB39150.1 hypothetical protein QY97_00052 [Bacillus thermotolerans]KKB42541.1 hypothetical protein QY96_01407 [Bacillus thermotolerans]KKB42770.1 hypothetical protein QY95_03791 [Bacillus thermotolerans]
MKIRKTFIQSEEVKVFIYENKKEESFVVAVPFAEWSAFFTYEEAGEELLERLHLSLSRTKLDEETAKALAHRIYQWTREM